MVTAERTAEVGELLARVREWLRPIWWARGDSRMDSDVDLVLLTTAERVCLDDESWVGSNWAASG
jgi:hypothetical protein